MNASQRIIAGDGWITVKSLTFFSVNIDSVQSNVIVSTRKAK